MVVVAFAPDLMDRTRIAAAAPDAAFARSPSDLAALVAERGAALVLVDLGRPGVLDVVGGLGVRVVGFGAHVEHELLAAARAAGCHEVMTRSAFFGGLAARLAGPAPGGSGPAPGDP